MFLVTSAYLLLPHQHDSVNSPLAMLCYSAYPDLCQAQLHDATLAVLTDACLPYGSSVDHGSGNGGLMLTLW